MWHKFRQSLFGEKIRLFFPNWVVNKFKHFPVALSAVLFFGYPARHLKVIGITGTDGKTTTATLLHEILSASGKKSALVSTVKTKIGSLEIKTGLHVTSPEPWILQKLLRHFTDQKVEYAILESTSQGLDQYRFLGCHFLMGLITNVTNEHLDYHKNYFNYLKAKSRLFEQVKVAIINRDDESFNYLNQELKKKKIRVITYGLENKADFTPQTFPFKTNLLGEYNQYNCLAAAAAASFFGVSKEVIKKTLAGFKGIEGRMDEIENNLGLRVFVDFAHTPNSLKNVLQSLSEIKKPGSRLIAVFGSAGGRDHAKRPLMGQNAARFADLIVLTGDDPRTESIEEISKEIAKGCLKEGFKDGKNLFRIADRAEGIKFAVQNLAKKSDIIVVCGKGHQKYFYEGKKEIPWDEHQVIKKAIKDKK
jgi:UDP-N-acetylmuramoyl-L-alanyl-D-glutamate--2,6-diaminopimelate ligase